MPEPISRRRFMRQASVGAAAAGAIAVGGAGSLVGVASATPHQTGSDEPTLDGSGVLAHVVDARTGEMSILVGTREVRYTDRAMAQQLLRAAQSSGKEA